MDGMFSSGAQHEVKEAAAYYGAEVEGLGSAFLGKLRDGVSESKEFPITS